MKNMRKKQKRLHYIRFKESTYKVEYLHLSKAFETDSCLLWEEKTEKPQGIM